MTVDGSCEDRMNSREHFVSALSPTCEWASNYTTGPYSIGRMTFIHMILLQCLVGSLIGKAYLVSVGSWLGNTSFCVIQIPHPTLACLLE